MKWIWRRAGGRGWLVTSDVAERAQAEAMERVRRESDAMRNAPPGEYRGPLGLMGVFGLGLNVYENCRGVSFRGGRFIA